MKELQNYLIEEEDELIKEITERTCHIIEVNAPSRRWQVDQIIKVLTRVGKYVSDDSICCLLQLIAATPEIQAYSLVKMFASLEQNMMQDALAKVTLWCIGEFGHLVQSGDVQISKEAIFSVMTGLLEQKCSKGVKAYILNCCIKLYARFDGNIPGIQVVFQKLSKDVDVDIQQRAFEYSNIIKSTRLSIQQKKSLLEEIPVSRISANIFNSKPVDVGGEVKSLPTDASVQPSLGGFGATGQKPPKTPSMDEDFLDILGERPSQTFKPDPSGPTSNPMDLMELDLTGGPQASSLRSTAAPLLRAPGPEQPAPGMFEFDLSGGISLPPQPTNSISTPGNVAGAFEFDLMGYGSQPSPASQPPQKPIAPKSHAFDNLIGLDMDLTSPQPANQAPVTAQHQSLDLGGGFDLMGSDLLGGSGYNAKPAPAGPAHDEFEFEELRAPATPGLTVTAFRDEAVEVKFVCRKEGPPSRTLINVTFDNLTGGQLGGVDLQIGSGKHLETSAFTPQNVAALEPFARGVVTHTIDVTNREHGKKAIAFKIKVLYSLGGQLLAKDSIVNGFAATY